MQNKEGRLHYMDITNTINHDILFIILFNIPDQIVINDEDGPNHMIAIFSQADTHTSKCRHCEIH